MNLLNFDQELRYQGGHNDPGIKLTPLVDSNTLVFWKLMYLIWYSCSYSFIGFGLPKDVFMMSQAWRNAWSYGIMVVENAYRDNIGALEFNLSVNKHTFKYLSMISMHAALCFYATDQQFYKPNLICLLSSSREAKSFRMLGPNETQWFVNNQQCLGIHRKNRHYPSLGTRKKQ